MTGDRPPRSFEALVQYLLPEDVAGDLAEGFAQRSGQSGPKGARWWYRREVMRCLLHLPSVRRPTPSPRNRAPDMVLQDLRFALRTLVRRPGFASVVIVTLALGLGATATIFSLMNTLFLRPVPGVESAEGVVELYGTGADANAGAFGGYLPMSWPTIRDVGDQTETLSDIYVYSLWPTSLETEGEAERVMAGFVSANYFDLLGTRPALGRGFASDEGVAGDGSPVAVLSHRFWMNRLGGDAEVIGTSVVVNTRSYTVVGVAPEGFLGTSNVFGPDFWVPLPMIRDVPTWGELWENRAVRMFFAGGRIAEGRRLAEVEAELAAIGGRLADTYPDEVRDRVIVPVPLAQATIFPGVRGPLLGAGVVLSAVVMLLLVIACINVANLLLARGLGRTREMAIRTAVGAGRGRLAAQLALESAVLFGLGGGLGLCLSVAAQRTLSGMEIPLLFGANVSLDVGTDLRVIGFASAITLCCALAFGMFPAWRASHGEVTDALREGSQGSGRSGPGRWLRNGLIVAQVAFSLVALIGAALFARSLEAARSVDPGFEYERLGMISVDLGAQRYDEDEGRAYYRRAVEAIAALPGVSSAAVGELRPLTPSGLRRVLRESDAPTDAAAGQMVRTGSVSPDYFESMGIPIVQGRTFLPSDDAGSPPVAVVNRRFGELFWPGESPVGRRIRIGLEDGVAEIVGVVPTGKYDDLTEDPKPAVYRPMDQLYAPTATLFVRGSTEAGTLAAARTALQQLDPALPLFDIEVAEALLGRALWNARALATLLAAFGLTGLLLAAIGIYGVVAHSVRERTREMGLRIALGAGPSSVLALSVRRVMGLASAGAFLGLATAAVLARPLGGLLFGVAATDPVVFGAIAGLLMTVAALASWVPARRATRIHPVQALRSE